jgi:vancomycin permeability regulator SanA
MLKRYKWWLLGGAILFLLVLWGPTLYFKAATAGRRYDLGRNPVASVPHEHVGIVFGAGILPGNKPTPYLQERVETAAKLYKAHRIDKLLMTGDNTRTSYNEPKVMKSLAVKLGIKSKDITLDFAGLSTYDSCYRAHAIFKVDSAVVITQGYHLPRAVMACSGLGIRTIGVVALHTSRDFTYNYIMREWISTDKITFQLVFKPHPTALGKTELID